MTCPTCNDTRRIRIGNEYKECPICRKPAPEPITLTVFADSVAIVQAGNQVEVAVQGVEISDVLDHITPEQALNHYGHEKLLDVMQGWQIKEYMKPTYD